MKLKHFFVLATVPTVPTLLHDLNVPDICHRPVCIMALYSKTRTNSPVVLSYNQTPTNSYSIQSNLDIPAPNICQRLVCIMALHAKIGTISPSVLSCSQTPPNSYSVQSILDISATNIFHLQHLFSLKYSLPLRRLGYRAWATYTRTPELLKEISGRISHLLCKPIPDLTYGVMERKERFHEERKRLDELGFGHAPS